MSLRPSWYWVLQSDNQEAIGSSLILPDKDSMYKHRQYDEQNVQQKSNAIYMKKEREIITAFGNF